MLKATDRPLMELHDVIALDLDGVVYVGPHVVDHAAQSLRQARAHGSRLAFMTNNASRSPREVADHLVELGVPAEPEDVVTSAQAAARVLSTMVAPGSAIYLIGGPGLIDALAEHGLRAVTSHDDNPVAVVQGYGPDMPWKQVVLGAVLVNEGLPWVATNTDRSIPLAAGIGPGNGTLVQLIADFSGRVPIVAGKPERALFDETIIRLGAQRPLMVGDRNDTDIVGARQVGWDSLQVMTGVTGLSELVALAPGERPTYLCADLRGLLTVQTVPRRATRGWSLGGWDAKVSDGELVFDGAGGLDDWWRVVACAAWDYADNEGEPVRTEALVAPAG
ncbi:MAG: HAD-IIA family hydrolase [Marmoricola sp.]